MVVTAQHFTETWNGRQQTTDGLWLHRGPLWIKESNNTSLPVFQVEPGTTVSRQQLAVGNDTIPRIHNGGWTDAHVRLDQTAPSEPRIGFHEAGSTALALYKQAGSNDVLRVRGQLGTDYALVGPVGSVSQVVYETWAGDIWSNVALGANNNGVPGFPVTVTFSGGYALVLMQASAQYSGPATTTTAGWTVAFQNLPHTRVSRQLMSGSTWAWVSCAAAVYISGPLNGGYQIGPYFFTSAAAPSGWYLRGTSAGELEYLRFTVIEVKR